MARGGRGHIGGPETRLERWRNRDNRADTPVESRGPQRYRASDAHPEQRDAVLVEISVVRRQRIDPIGDVIALAGELQIARRFPGAGPVDGEHRESRLA